MRSLLLKESCTCRRSTFPWAISSPGTLSRRVSHQAPPAIRATTTINAKTHTVRFTRPPSCREPYLLAPYLLVSWSPDLVLSSSPCLSVCPLVFLSVCPFP